MDHLTRPLVVLDDVFQDLAHLRQVGGAGAEKTLRRLHVAQNGGERLIELVRQRRRQLAHRGEARHVGKLRAMALRLVLRVFPLRDVEDRSQDESPFRGLDGRDADFDRDLAAVLTSTEQFPPRPQCRVLQGWRMSPRGGTVAELRDDRGSALRLNAR